MIARTRLFLPCLAAALWTLGASFAAPADGRVIVLGFDGADARTLQHWMERGELPNFARLAREGSFAPLQTSTPDESPVAWAVINSGQNPAKTGVPGFVKRELGADAPFAAKGFVDYVDRPLAELDAGPVTRFLGTQPPALSAALAGAATVLVFFLVLTLALKLRRGAALGIAAVLGGVGGWGGWSAAHAIPPVFDDVVSNPCRVGGFWEHAARHGVASVVLEAAMSWDRPEVPGARVLSGLGLPDARGDNCEWFVYTTRASEIETAPACNVTPTGGRVFRLSERNGRFESALHGPADLLTLGRLLGQKRELQALIAEGRARDADLDRLDEVNAALRAARVQQGSEENRLSVPLAIELRGARARVTIGETAQELAPGQWSDWYRVEFEFSPLLRLAALTRARLMSLEPLELYVDTLQIDPAAAPFWQPVSQPPGFSAELAQGLGEGFETVGWACLTMPLKDGRIDAQTFLEDIEFTQRFRVELFEAALARDDWRLLFFTESTPDRVQHMLYRHHDTAHPAHDAAAARQVVRYFGEELPLDQVILATYRAMDALLGRVLDRHLRPDDTLILCSDHGFQSFRRQVHLNNWLAREGYLALHPDLAQGDDDELRFVDWSKTRAYALGLGGIYVNQQGREPQGIVAPGEEADALLAEITQKLLALRDGEAPAVHDVLRTRDIHHGPHLDLEADLLPGFAAGWRVSWKTTRGGLNLAADTRGGQAWVAGPVFEDNLSPWSGDHVSVSSALVPGIFLCNRRVELPPGGVELRHLAPTVLQRLGVPIPAEFDLPPLKLP